MNARAEVQRPLRSCLSASQSAQRLARLSGSDMPPPESESGATLPLFAFDFGKQSAQGEACRHERLLPVRAETLGSVCEANKARPQRGMHKRALSTIDFVKKRALTAEDIGFCLICGTYSNWKQCSCSSPNKQNFDQVPNLLTLVCLVKRSADVREIHWHLCTTKGCKTLIAVPDNRPAVRCPICDQVTQ